MEQEGKFYVRLIIIDYIVSSKLKYIKKKKCVIIINLI